MIGMVAMVPRREEEDEEEEVHIVVDAGFHPALRSRLLAFSTRKRVLLLYVRLCIYLRCDFLLSSFSFSFFSPSSPGAQRPHFYREAILVFISFAVV